MLRKAAIVCLSTTFLVMASMLFVAIAPADPGGHPYKPGEVIIKFKSNASDQDKNEVRAELGGYQMKGWGRIKAELRRLDPDLTVDEAISRYKNHPKVQYIEPNYIVEALETPNDPRFPELWGMENTGQTGGTPGADISATNAWDVFTGSSSVLVGVIDTGVDYTHPDLAANIWTNPGEIPGNGIDDDGNGFIDDIHGWDFYNDDNDPMDDHGHGSHVSGTIGGVGDNGIGVAGVCWHVKIMGLKFLSSGGSGSTDDAIDAVNYATMMGVKLTSNSWGGGGFSQALYDAISDANDAGILFVAAAGNNGANSDVSPSYPAAYDLPNIISVAATDHNDQLASFSNYGAVSVDLAAPGVDILSTFPGNTYGTISGTSMATPHVSGACALVFGRFPGIGHLDAKNLIMNFADPLPQLSGLMVTGARLNAFFPIAEPDSVSPGTITDVAVTDAGSNWLIASWTATGDDDGTGTASRYIVKVSTAPIDDMNFDAAMTVPNPPDPDPAGSPQSMKVSGLDFDTSYYIAIKALDEFGNASGVSNNGSGTTLGIPDIDVTPTSLSATLLSGASSTLMLTMSNVGFGTLDFEIPVPDLITGAPEPGVFAAYGKDEPDPRTGAPVLQGLGGPDAHGYRWVDSDEAFGPTFSWTDISGTGTAAITSGDDTNAGPFPIGFTFSYYGVEYNAFRVCSNGFLSFTSTSTDYGNQPLPNTGAPFNLVAPFWDDLNVASGGSVYYESDGTRLIVQWNNVPHYSAGGPYTFQAILNADGTIEFEYLSMGSPDNSATVGIQNASGTDGLQVAYNTTYIHDNLAVRIVSVPQWVTVTPTSGTVYAPNSTTLNVNLNSTGLLGGIYDGNVRIQSNDPDEPTFTVPVELTVIGAPDIDVAPTAYDFGQVFLGAAPTTEILVQNPGTDVLTVSGITFDNAAYSADVTSFSVPARSSQTVVVTFVPVAVGSYPATMTINSDDPDEPSVTVSLSGEGVEPPDFSVAPTSLSADLFTGESEVQQLTLTNAGGADLEYSIGVDLGAQVVVYDRPDLAKGEDDANPGIQGTGGPDAFGYSWIDSDEPGGPAFDWTEISGVGTPAYSGNSDDGNMGPFPIGFNFPFYGNSFGTFRVCANGWMSFSSSSTDYSNGPLPGTGDPENLLAVYFDDMYVDADIPSNVYYYNDGARLIVQWDNIRKLSQSDTAPPFYKFQAILYPNGTIVYQYLTVGTVNNSATVGIQNDARDDGLNISYNTEYAHDGLAVRIAAAPEWLAASPLSGTIPPGGSQPVNVTFNAADLFGGLYVGGLMIDTNDPLAPHVTVPCNLQVTGAPDAVVSPTSIDFGQIFVGYPDLHGLSIFNAGTDQLTITGFSSDNPAFSVFLGGTTLPIHVAPLASTVIQVRFAPPSAAMFAGTLSVLSNDPDSPTIGVALSGEGLIAPIAGVTPTSMSADLLTGETEGHTATLTNTGGSDLTFDVAFDLGAASVEVYDRPDLAKGEEDLNPGILGSGGPDVFGYRWKDSDDPGGPVYNWVDISGVGTPIFGNADDSNLGPFPIGFNFSFYGNTFTEFRVCSNGFISFTSTSTDLSNAPLPGTGAPENLLAIYHDDLYVDSDIPSQVYYYNDGTRLIVQFDQVRLYRQSDTSPPFLTFEAILYPNGSIIYQYQTVGTGTNNNSATVGIQNATQDDGLTIVYDEEYAHDGLAVRIATTPQWLTANPTSGTVPPGGSIPIAVTFDANGLFGGAYDGGVLINNNDPAHGQLRIDAHLDVTGVPRIGFSDASLDFGEHFIGYPASMNLTVTNVGTDLLSVNSIASGLPDYSVNMTTFDLAPLASQEIMVTFDPQAAGTRSTDLTFVSNDPDSPHTVSLTGIGVIPPVMSPSPTSMVGVAMPGGTTTETLTICNTGGSDLIWTAGTTTYEPTVYTEQILPKAQDVPGAEVPEDPRPGILGTGGPDTFGYKWTDSDEPGGPTYDWTDISGVGTPVGFPSYQDDGNVGPVPIGFDFSFYGNTFDHVYVCTNGWVSFTNSSLTTYTNQPLPNSGSSTPENLLAPFWDDMVVDDSYAGEVLSYNDGSRFILQFYIRRIATYTGPFYKFQVILYPNGHIVYQYNTLGAVTNSATVGIQNADKDDGLTVVFNDTYVHEGLAVEFSAGPDWLSMSPESGVIPAGECADVTVTMNASELEAGDYFGNIMMSSNDPANPTETADVVFHVGTVDAADFDVDPNTVNLVSSGKWIGAYVELPMGYDPADVVPGTVRLNGTVPADVDHVTIGDWNHNSVPDLAFKFDRAAVEAILPEGDAVPVTVTGEIMDTIYFVGMDYVRVLRPHIAYPMANVTMKAGGYRDILWTNPDGWSVDYATLTYSPDDGNTWSLIADNVTGNTYHWQVPTDPTTTGRIRVYVNDNRGVMGYATSEPFAISSSVTGVENRMPTVFALMQNAPNPFAGATHIAYDLPEDAKVQLRVFDVSGRMVRMLENRVLPAGSYVAVWDGRDAGGRSMASGIYFYRLDTDKFTSTKRMFLMK